MKKFLISSLLVLLTICLFVSCSSSPKEEEQSISFTNGKGVVFTFYRNNKGIFVNGTDSSNIDYIFNSTLIIVKDGTSFLSFWKDKSSSIITSAEELFSLTEIYDNDSNKFEKTIIQ